MRTITDQIARQTAITVVCGMIISCIIVGLLLLSHIDTPKTKEAIPLTRYFEGEYKTIAEAALRNSCYGDDFFVLLAIRKAENGRSGLQFGIMVDGVDTLDEQAGWAAATIVKNRQRWFDAGCPGDFIVFLGNRYCPVGAKNDPSGLNSNWVKNVKYWFNKLKGE